MQKISIGITLYKFGIKKEDALLILTLDIRRPRKWICLEISPDVSSAKHHRQQKLHRDKNGKKLCIYIRKRLVFRLIFIWQTRIHLTYQGKHNAHLYFQFLCTFSFEHIIKICILLPHKVHQISTYMFEVWYGYKQKKKERMMCVIE